VKPSLSIVAGIDVGIADVVNNLTHPRSLKHPKVRIISAHIKWLLLLFFIDPSICHATLILTACATDRVIVAADGLALKPGQTPSSMQICKIRQGTDSCFISIAGFPSNAEINYDLWIVARRACKGSGSIVERAKTFENNALPEVRRAWKYIKVSEPAAYAALKKISVDGRGHMDVVFAGGPPYTVVIVHFIEDASGSMTIGDPTISVPNLTGQTAIAEVGVTEDAAGYRRYHPEVTKLETRNFLRSVLLGAIQLEGDPKRIGPPIAILEIRATGAKWIEQGACANIKHYAQGSSPKKLEKPAVH
jgi:hypothetical protein